jgi:hypothetical protein
MEHRSADRDANANGLLAFFVVEGVYIQQGRNPPFLSSFFRTDQLRRAAARCGGLGPGGE